MYKFIHLLSLAALVLASATACFKEEQPNAVPQAEETFIVNPTVSVFANDTLTIEQYLFLPLVTIDNCTIELNDGVNSVILPAELSQYVREPSENDTKPRSGVIREGCRLLSKPIEVEGSFSSITIEYDCIFRQPVNANREWILSRCHKRITETFTKNGAPQTFNIADLDDYEPLCPIFFTVSITDWCGDGSSYSIGL